MAYFRESAKDPLVLKTLGEMMFSRNEINIILTTHIVVVSLFMTIAETASDTFVAYYLVVPGWGDPAVLIETSLLEESASGQNNLVSLFGVFRESESLSKSQYG